MSEIAPFGRISMSGTASDRRAFLLGLSGALASGPSALADHTSVFRLGVFPYLPPLTLDRLFAPVLTSLESALHRKVLMRTKQSFEAFEVALAARRFDIAFVHPFLAVHAIDGYGYEPLARVDGPFQLAFLARKEMGLAGPADLRDQLVLVPPERSAAAVLAALTLEEHGLRPGTDVTLASVSSKMSCVHTVLRGEAAGCALPAFAVRQLGFDADPRLTVFHVASLPTGLSLVAGEWLGRTPRARLIREICDWSQTDDGHRLLEHAGWPGFVAASNADYEAARQALARVDRVGGRS